MADDKDKDEKEPQFEIVETDDSGKPLAPPDGKGADDGDGGQARDALRTADDADADDDGQDERVDLNASEQERKEKRDLRKAQAERRRLHYQRLENENKLQKRINQELEQRLAALETHSGRQDLATVQTRLQTATGQLKQANSIFAAAIKAGDAARIAEAMEVRDAARDQVTQLAALDQRIREGGTERRPAGGRGGEAVDPGAGSQLAPAVQRRVDAFRDKHEWYNPEAPDQDTEVVLALDSALAREGYDPATKQYWDELERRVARTLPHRVKPAAGDGRGRVSPVEAGGQNGSGARPNGRNIVYVSPERKKAMMEAGAWEDPVKRNRMLKRYAEYDKERASERRTG